VIALHRYNRLTMPTAVRASVTLVENACRTTADVVTLVDLRGAVDPLERPAQRPSTRR
jgi:hypothetical protein